jgi:hypothetical protein
VKSLKDILEVSKAKMPIKDFCVREKTKDVILFSALGSKRRDDP